MTGSFSVRTIVTRICLALITCIISACTVPFPVYSVAGKNVESIRAVPATIKVGNFAGNQTSVSCRLQPLGPENNETYASFIRNAFNNELIISGGVPHNTTIELNGTLKKIEVDCGIVSGSWTIEMELSINNQPPFTVKTVRKFDGNYSGEIVLKRATGTFVPAVQQFLNEVLNSPSVQTAAATSGLK